MKRTSGILVTALLASLVGCSSEPDEACESISDDVATFVQREIDDGYFITGEMAGIRDGDWWNAAAVVASDRDADERVAVWRVHEIDGNAGSIGGVTSSDLMAGHLSDWPSELLDSGVVDAASSCVST